MVDDGDVTTSAMFENFSPSKVPEESNPNVEHVMYTVYPVTTTVYLSSRRGYANGVYDLRFIMT